MINKTLYLTGSIFCFLFLLLSCLNDFGEKEKIQTNIKATDKKEIFERPAWINDIPLVLAGGWDSEPATQRRWGTLTTDYMDEYNRRMSEETVLKLKEMGITLVITHFFKGYGLKGEGAYMDKTIKFAELCHKHGLRVGVYVGNTICYEQMLLENPGAKDWLAPDYLGEPVTWGGTQTFRRYPYIGHPDYQKYIRKVLKKAILEAKVDLIHFDNSSQYGKPEIYFHPLAIKHFQDYLKNKYTADQLEDRFDFTDVKYIVPPKYNGTPQPIQDPLFQEWTDFRCWKVSEYLQQMRQYIKSLNPEVVVEGNHQGDNGDNLYWFRGRDLAKMLPYTEASWSEIEEDPKVTKEGILVSRIRSLKIARTFNNKLFYHSGHDKLLMAEAMAYNANCIGYIGALLSPYYWDDNAIRYVKYFHDHFQYYHNTKTITPVAVLRTFPTMAYGSHNTSYNTYLFEQTLIQTKIPFAIIFDQHLKEDLSKYKVLILADQECMTDEQIELIRTFVDSGGGLVITGNTSLYNEWRRRRNKPGLRDLFDTDLPYPPGTRVSQTPWAVDSKWYRHSSLIKDLEGFTEENTGQIRQNYGKGRIAFIPHIKPSVSKPSSLPPKSAFWKLPENYPEIEEAVRWAAGGPFGIEVTAPLNVTMEWVMQQETNKMMVHLVNYDAQNQVQVENIKIRLEIPDGKKVKKIEIFSPDSNFEDEIVPLQKNQDTIYFIVPVLYTYDLVVVTFE